MNNDEPSPLKSSNGDELKTYQLESAYSLKGHRREITCLDFDKEKKIVVAGGRDRILTTWNVESKSYPGTLLQTRNDAHERLITSVKIYKNCVFSSSR